MKRWRKPAFGLVVGFGVMASVFIVTVLAGKGLLQASLWAAVLAAFTGIVSMVATIWPLISQRTLAPARLEVPVGVVSRPDEVSAVVRSLADRRSAAVGITTALHGAGGFGKTTLAMMVCADRRVRRRFRGNVELVTVGRDVRGPVAIAARVNDVIKLVAGEDATFTDPDLAGRRLGALLDSGPRRLLVLDDVWEADQLAPFMSGGRQCARLVTTRVPELLAGHGAAVLVDQMSSQQARAVLTSDLPPLDAALVEGLLAVTGRWPLLLRLINKILTKAACAGADVPAAAIEVLARLRAGGPAVVDDLSGEARHDLDVGRPRDRARAVRATIEASTSLLESQDAQRFAELGVFASGETIPFGLAARLWRATAGLDELSASQLFARLAELALVSLKEPAVGGVALHDVVREFLRDGLGPVRLAELTGVLINAVASDLPAAESIKAAAPGSTKVAWWVLPFSDRYLRDHLIEHLLEAGRLTDAEQVAGDLRWVSARLREAGPAAPAADLALVGTPKSARLEAALARVAHLLAPTEPGDAVVDVLHSRVAADPEWGPQAAVLRGSSHGPRLVNRWQLPDRTSPALRRTLIDGLNWVNDVAVAPDGSWLAAACDGGTRIWDTDTGRLRAVLTDHQEGIATVAISPDGTWLATGGEDRTVRIWDLATGRQRVALTDFLGAGVREVAISPDGTWLATGGRRLRIWDAATGRQRASLRGHAGPVTTVRAAPDSSWLATTGIDGTIRIWDPATGRQRHVLSIDKGPSAAVAVAPDSSWLAAIGEDGTVRIWDPATGRQKAVLSSDQGRLTRIMAVAPDCSWLAAQGNDGSLRIWDVSSGQQRAILADHMGGVTAAAVAPDGSWLAIQRNDGSLRIWDVSTGQQRAVLAGHWTEVDKIKVAPDGSWLATLGRDYTVRIWDTAPQQQDIDSSGCTEWVAEITVAPDGSWLATADDRTVRIWDPSTGRQHAEFTGHQDFITAVTACRDGSWLATGSNDGTVRIWDPFTGQQRAEFTAHQYSVDAIAVFPDARHLITCGRHDEEVKIWNTATGQQRAALACRHRGGVRTVAMAANGNLMATGGWDGMVRIWGRRRAIVARKGSEVSALIVAPDGSWLAATCGTMGWIWDAASGKLRASLPGHRHRVTAIAASTDGCWLATGDFAGTVRIWDTAIGQPKALMRVESRIHACAWINSRELAVGGPAGLYVFDLLADAAALSPTQ